MMVGTGSASEISPLGLRHRRRPLSVADSGLSYRSPVVYLYLDRLQDPDLSAKEEAGGLRPRRATARRMTGKAAALRQRGCAVLWEHR